MGISGLNKFIENNGLRKRVKVAKEIENFRRENNIEEPIIVVDFNAGLRIFTGRDKWEDFYGTRSTIYTSLAEKFCRKIQGLKAKLVFYLEGPIKPEKLDEWVRRRDQKYKEQRRLFEKIRSNRITKNDLNGINVLGAAYDCVQIVIKELNCGHQLSLQNECDLDLCDYATKNNALAVIANDSDFFAMPGDWDVWHVDNFDIDSMTALKICKKDVRERLHLEKKQMSIFATLCGNDFLDKSQVKDLTRSFAERYNCEIHDSIAKFIQNNPITEASAEKIAEVIRSKQITDNVQRSLAFYNCDFTPEIPKPGLEWVTEFSRETLMTFIYTIKMELPFTIDSKMIDLSLSEFKPFAKLVLPMIQRQAGVILADQRSSNQFMTIYFKADDLSSYKRHRVEIVYPQLNVPSIKALVDKDPSTIISEDQKINIFLWMVFSNADTLEDSKWKKLLDENADLFLPVIILCYLIQEDQIQVSEADAILLCTYKMVHFQTAERNLITRPINKPTARSAWLAFTYTQIGYFFRNALIIAGLKQYLRKDYFDGYLYHQFYHNRSNNINDIRDFRYYASGNN